MDKHEFLFELKEVKKRHCPHASNDVQYVSITTGMVIINGDNIEVIVDDNEQSDNMLISKDSLLNKIIKKIHNVTKKIYRVNILNKIGVLFMTELKKDKEILALTGEVWNRFIKLEQTHPNDIDEFAKGIHQLQRIIATRMCRRDYPNIFPTKK